MSPQLHMRRFTPLLLGISGLVLAACSSHSAGGRYADSGVAYGGGASHGAYGASAECYSNCNVRWVNRVIAIPTTHTIETKYVEQPAKIEYVDREVVKEVIKEVIVEREVPMRTPCPVVSYPEPPKYEPMPYPEDVPPVQQDCYPEPSTPWTPPPVIRK